MICNEFYFMNNCYYNYNYKLCKYYLRTIILLEVCKGLPWGGIYLQLNC